MASNGGSRQEGRLISKQELAKHNKKEDAWIIIDGKVYDMTEYVAKHPGGDAILRNVGGDATSGFHSQPAHFTVGNYIKDKLKNSHYVGDFKS
ncbi:cytochrome B5-like protein [Branchiostoma floridae]|uniref:Cytochrome B5-like protein n=1 Tax=Branchiostoma floridae TaxID=7739 RepID=A0A9J7HW97_BRAFL|nr:cytochrome B5-like protein [Branchiostoma floridae]